MDFDVVLRWRLLEKKTFVENIMAAIDFCVKYKDCCPTACKFNSLNMCLIPAGFTGIAIRTDDKISIREIQLGFIKDERKKK